MMVDLFRSTVRPLGTGISSNSLRWTFGGLDAQAVMVTRQSDNTRKRRMASTSRATSYYRWGWPTKFLAGFLALALLSGCASTNIPPMGYQGKPFRPEPDERKLWSDAEKEEEKLAKLGKTYDDPLLEDYLASVAAKLVPEEAQEAGPPAPPPHRGFPRSDPHRPRHAERQDLYPHRPPEPRGERVAAGHDPRPRDDPRDEPPRPDVQSGRAEQADLVQRARHRRFPRGGGGDGQSAEQGHLRGRGGAAHDVESPTGALA